MLALPGCHGGCGCCVRLGLVPLLSCPCVKQLSMGSALLLGPCWTAESVSDRDGSGPDWTSLPS